MRRFFEEVKKFFTSPDNLFYAGEFAVYIVVFLWLTGASFWYALAAAGICCLIDVFSTETIWGITGRREWDEQLTAEREETENTENIQEEEREADHS